MFDFLKDHPFAVDAFFERSVVLTFAFPKSFLEKLLPPCLSIDTYDDQYGFVAVAMVQTKNLRPKGFPKFMGNNFFLIGYRIFVRYVDSRGKKLRGLYIIKSETDKKKMEFFGNMFTHYNYTTTDISQSETYESLGIRSKKSNFFLKYNRMEDAALPVGSPFPEWKIARRYAGPLPFTFTYDSSKKEVLIIEGVRTNWKPKPIEISEYYFEFIDQLGCEEMVLANAFEITQIPYSWKKGKKEKWHE